MRVLGRQPVYLPLRFHEIEFVASPSLLAIGEMVKSRFDIPRFKPAKGYSSRFYNANCQITMWTNGCRQNGFQINNFHFAALNLDF